MLLQEAAYKRDQGGFADRHLFFMEIEPTSTPLLGAGERECDWESLCSGLCLPQVARSPPGFSVSQGHITVPGLWKRALRLTQKPQALPLPHPLSLIVTFKVNLNR